MMQRPIDLAVEYVEVRQARIQEGWGSPQTGNWGGVDIEVDYKDAPEQGSNPPEADIAARELEGWTYKAFDPDAEDPKAVVFEETDRHIFGRRLAQAALRKQRFPGKPLSDDVTAPPEATEEDEQGVKDAAKRQAEQGKLAETEAKKAKAESKKAA